MEDVMKYIEQQQINNQFANVWEEINPLGGYSAEYLELYSNVDNEPLQKIFSSLHYYLIGSFRTMNERLPATELSNRHFGAEYSRRLKSTIEITLRLYHKLKTTDFAFEIDKKYMTLMEQCRDFLRESRGSDLPLGMQKIELYLKIPIFRMLAKEKIQVKRNNHDAFKLTLIGEGSYANVYKYKDDYYGKYFAVKRAKNDISNKDLERFRREFDEIPRCKIKCAGSPD